MRILSGSTNATANYTLATNTGTVKVTKRTVSVAPVGRSLNVDGNNHGLTDYRITSTTKMASGDRISSVNFTNNSHSAAGDYTVGISKVNVSPSKAEGSYNFNTGTATLTLNATGGGGGGGGTTVITTPPTDGGRTTTDNTGDRSLGVPEPTVNPADGGTDTVQNTETIPNVDGTENIPSLSIGDSEIPLFGTNAFPSWALLNLILSIIGVVMILMLFIPIAARKRELDRLEEEGHERGKFFNGKWLAVGIVFAVAQLIVFLTTQNMQGTMVLMDVWSIVHVVATALGIASVMFTQRVDDDIDDEYDYQ